MNTENNKAIVKNFFELMNKEDPTEMLECLSDDFLFEAMMQKPEAFNFTWNKDQFAAASGGMSSQMVAPLKIWIESMIAEGDAVAAEAKSYGELKNGKLYENAYHFLVKLRNGKIFRVREYSCSYTAATSFGGFDGNF